jgi:hypothetical protein
VAPSADQVVAKVIVTDATVPVTVTFSASVL